MRRNLTTRTSIAGEENYERGRNQDDEQHRCFLRRAFDNSGDLQCCVYTQPVGLGSPATLHAPLAGPEGNSS